MITALRHVARTMLAALVLAASTAAPASTGLMVLHARPGSVPVTVLYPSDSPAQTVRRMAHDFQLADSGRPVAGNGRLVVLSHGLGGSPWVQADLALALVAAGYTVAQPEHEGDNWHDHRKAGPLAWTQRPAEVSQAIDAVAREPRLAPLQLDLQHVGLYGMSAGGITALTLAGARWSPARFADYCRAHGRDNFALCGGLMTELRGDWLDGLKLALMRWIVAWRFGGDSALRSAHDARIAAIVAAVPVAAPIDPASLAPPRVPLALIRAGHDEWLVPRYHIDAIRPACEGSRRAGGAPGCVLLADLPGAAHGSILSPPPRQLPPLVARVMDDPPGFDRAQVTTVYAAIVRFFDQHLTPRTGPSPA